MTNVTYDYDSQRSDCCQFPTKTQMCFCKAFVGVYLYNLRSYFACSWPRRIPGKTKSVDLIIIYKYSSTSKHLQKKRSPHLYSVSTVCFKNIFKF